MAHEDTYATVDDVAAGWRQLTPREQEVAAVLIERASAILDEQASTDDEALLRIAVCEMVQHALAPDAFGYSSDVADVQGWLPDTPAGKLWLSGDTKDLVGWKAQQIGSIGFAVGE